MKYNLKKFKEWVAEDYSSGRRKRKNLLQHLEELINLLEEEWNGKDVKSILEIPIKKIEEISGKNYEESRLLLEDCYEKINIYFSSKDKAAVNAQEWLDTNYPDKENVTAISSETETDKTVTGGLTISDFPELKSLNLHFSDFFYDGNRQLKIENCPKLEKVLISHAINFASLKIENCPNIIDFREEENAFSDSEINDIIIKMPKLQVLETDRKVDINNNPDLRFLWCWKGNPLLQITTKLREHETNLATAQQELERLQEELIKLNQVKDKLAKKDQAYTELESQLTSLAVSSGLLSQQCENLSQQLTETQQKETVAKLELEIKENLLEEKNNKISQQEQEIKNYQQLLRTSEENLKKCQETISQKTELIKKLEREKNLIAEELELANSKINELESALRNSCHKISHLEKQIKELENKGDNSAELVNLKKELVAAQSKNQSEKDKYSQEIKKLQSELAAIKQQERKLNQKIKEIGEKSIVVEEISPTPSFWQKIKTPLYYIAGIILIMIVLGWFYNKFKK